MELKKLFKKVYPYSDVGVPNKIDLDKIKNDLLESMETEFIRVLENKKINNKELSEAFERQYKRFYLLQEVLRKTI